MSEVLEAPKNQPQSAEKPTGDAGWGLGALADAGLFLTFLALTFLLGVFPLRDTDFWWHLKTGDLIRQTGSLPTVDTYTFKEGEGHAWTDLHWIFSGLAQPRLPNIGVPGLNLAKCVVNCVAIGLADLGQEKEWPLWVMLLAWIPSACLC